MGRLLPTSCLSRGVCSSMESHHTTYLLFSSCGLIVCLLGLGMSVVVVRCNWIGFQLRWITDHCYSEHSKTRRTSDSCIDLETA
jgi:hypothetical protein